MFSFIDEICEEFIIEFDNEYIKYEADIINIFNRDIQFKTDNMVMLRIIDLYYR